MTRLISVRLISCITCDEARANRSCISQHRERRIAEYQFGKFQHHIIMRNYDNIALKLIKQHKTKQKNTTCIESKLTFKKRRLFTLTVNLETLHIPVCKSMVRHGKLTCIIVWNIITKPSTTRRIIYLRSMITMRMPVKMSCIGAGAELFRLALDSQRIVSADL